MSVMQPDRSRKVTIVGAVLAALAASSCCLGPLVLAALGIGGAGALAALGAYRPYILGLTTALLAAGFYLTYRTPRASAAGGDACGCEKPAAGRAGKIGLWMATGLVGVFVAAPNVLAYVERRSRNDASALVPGAAIARAALRVHGMDCEACAGPIRGALAKVGGFHDLTLDLQAQTVTVTYEPAAGRLEAYVAAIDELGYEASLPAPDTR